jgi:hypothetical protein
VKNSRFWPAFGWLLLVNIITSFLKLPYDNINQIWYLIGIAFLLTIPIEALLIRLFYKSVMRDKPYSYALKISTCFNTASYLIMVIYIAYLIYVPMIGVDDPALKAKLKGKIVLQNIRYHYLIDVEKSKELIHLEDTNFHFNRVFNLIKKDDNSYYYIDEDSKLVLCDIKNNKITEKIIRTSKQGKELCAITPDLETAVYEKSDGFYLNKQDKIKRINIKISSIDQISNDSNYLIAGLDSGKTALINTINNEILERFNCYSAIISPNSKYIALRNNDEISMYNIEKKIYRKFKLPSKLWFLARIAWSPDSKCIVYFGFVNKNLNSNWDVDLRAIDINTGKTTTIIKQLHTFGIPLVPLWL